MWSTGIVSIRFRWRLAGKKSALTDWAYYLTRFNPLSLETGWKDDGKKLADVTYKCFNPLSLETGWKEKVKENGGHVDGMFQSAFAGDWLESPN